MYVNVRIKTLNNDLATIKVEIPKDLRDYDYDTLNDVVSDYLDDNVTEVKWFRIIQTL